MPPREPQNARLDALGIGKAARIVETADGFFGRAEPAGRVDVVTHIVADVDMRALHPAFRLHLVDEIDDDLIGGEAADLLRAALARRGRDLDEPRLVELFDVRRDRPVGDVERLRKIGEVELPLLQQLVEDAETDIRIERLIQKPPV